MTIETSTAEQAQQWHPARGIFVTRQIGNYVMWETGTVTTDSGEVIARPGMTIEEFQSKSFYNQAVIEPTGPGYRLVRELEQMTFNGYKCDVIAIFFGNSLSTLTLQLSEVDVNRVCGADVENASVRRQAELEFLQSWVKEQCGRRSPAQFKWGTIAAARDIWDPSFCFIEFNYER